MGRSDEQHSGSGEGDRSPAADPHVTQKKSTRRKAEAENASAFSVPLEQIDAILLGNSDVSEGKYLIYEQYLKGQTQKENCAFLRDHYGSGGSSYRQNGKDFSINYNRTGFSFSVSSRNEPAQTVRLTWMQISSRIEALIQNGTYFNEAERNYYPAYKHKMALRKARSKIADEFKDVIRCHNDYQQQLGNTGAVLNQYVLVDCASQFTCGRKTTPTLGSDNYILPLMRQALESIISGHDELELRCKALLVDLSGELAAPMEPSFDELNPPPEPAKGYRVPIGDTLYIGVQQYELLSIENGTVTLYDPSFPLMHTQYSLEEFHRLLSENPLNDRHLEIVPLPDKLFARAKELIDDFVYTRYRTEPDYSNLEAVGLGFTTTEDEAHTIHVSANLKDHSIDVYLDEKLYRQEKYASLQELITVELEALSTLDLLALIDEKDLTPKAQDTASPPQDTHADPSTEKAVIDPSSQNFRITDDAHGSGTAGQHYKANVAAIRCLKQLEIDDRAATPAEKDILAKYVGWGGLGDVFDSRHSKYQELRSLLTSEEYQRAKASTLDAFYTSPIVIKAIYQAIADMGFEQGKILKPAMGIGNFFGALPDSMAGSQLFGVELDPISGRIAQKLYPNADITIAGFETTKQHNFYDLAVGNIPFGQIKVHDPAYNQWNFSIHNYFFAKAIDQVRPGGIIAFVTSHYTLDAKTSKARKYIAERAELLGAIRLPNNAFKANAGTDVVSDIIFLQKREAPVVADPDWLHLETTDEGYTLNSYFVHNPDMVLGQLAWKSTPYGENECTVIPHPEKSLSVQLQDAVQRITGKYVPLQETAETALQSPADELPHDPSLRPWSYTVRNNDIYYQEDGALQRQEVGATAAARIKGLIELRECVRNLISMQLDPDIADEDLQAERDRLNKIYDRFVEKYGLICTRGNRIAFRNDSAYPLLLSLEVMDEDGIYEGKADIFTRRTVRPSVPVTHVDTAAEALAVSIGEKARIDIDYMSELTGKSPAELEEDLIGVIFRDIVCNTDAKRIPFEDVNLQKYPLIPADEYLSGNVRQKLRMAKAMLDALPADKRKFIQANVDALEKAQPQDLDATEISVRLGATWIPPEDIRQFILDILKPPIWAVQEIKVEYAHITGEWIVQGKSRIPTRDVNATVTYGTSRINAYELIERTLNMRDIRIYDVIKDRDGTHHIFNPKETVLVQQRQQLIQDTFRDWIWEDPERRNRLVHQYNEQFNSTKPREYDGSHIVFGGINPEIQLRPHQLGAIAHILYGGNTLLAHCVGAGKTFEMIASIMESKRLGLSSKAMIAVPNHLTDQWSNEFLTLYPAANILVAHEEDFAKENRRKFFGRIATGDYDAIIIGQSQFERIPVSFERRKAWLQKEIDELQDGIDVLQANRAEYFSVKQIERQKRNLEARLEKLTDGSTKDHVVTFEELGIDRLYVDEAHAYKNLYCFTKMTRVAGLSTAESQRATDMLMKCRYLDEITDYRGVVFATGTPVSNTMVELYTMQRYLQYRRLQELGLASFDAWASVFGETITAMELAPEGSGYRTRTRFAKFYNLPELMNLFKEVADIKTADQLNLPVPEVVYHTEVCKPTEAQIEMVKELARRASAIHNGSVDPSIDNMLRITSDGRKLGLDQRIIEPLLPDEPFSKVNRCVAYALEDWKNGAAEKLTQVIFCDLSTPKKAAKQSADAGIWEAAPFSVYEDIRSKLIQNGVPADEIAFIHNADTSAKKRKLFGKVRAGEVRILLGSTSKMGAGTNVQDRLYTLHDLYCPWRPGDLEQRSGRIVRQGNRNKQVNIRRYVTEGTFDAYLWQTVEIKQRFISQILTSKSPVRSAEDIDDVALSFAEIKSLCAGDPRVKEKMDLDVEVSKLQILKANYKSQRYSMQNQLLHHFPEQIERYKGFISALQDDAKTVLQNPEPAEGFVGITLNRSFYKDKLDAGETLLSLCGQQAGSDQRHIGSFRGFELYLQRHFSQHVLYLRGKAQHEVVLGQDPRGNFIRISNVLNAIPVRISETQQLLDNTYEQIEKVKAELEKPFAQEAELYQKSQRLIELNAELNMDTAAVEKEKSAEHDTISLP